MPDQEVEIPRAKNLRRTGKCLASGCTCSDYLSGGTMDGFNICTCTHTQNSHELGARHVS